MEEADSHFLEMGSALAQGFAIQGFFIPIMKQNPHRKNYGRILIITYAIGITVYTFIGYSGAISIFIILSRFNKQTTTQKQPPRDNRRLFR